MEASALHAPPGLSRLTLATPLLRLRSDDQLVALFRAGSDDAFGVICERYRTRLLAYVRQMMPGHSRQDAEDVLQDVFVRAFAALRHDERPLNVRAWLYRVAHNRCIDLLRRPVPPAAEVFEVSRAPGQDPVEATQRREDLRRLVTDVSRLPDQQRSALLMREMNGMSYADLAVALDVTVPAVKSLLVRARTALVEAQASRDADCADIRRDLHQTYDRGVKASGRARRHVRECAGCREYRSALRDVRRSLAALTPVGAGPGALLAKLLGVGGAGGGAAAAGSAGAGATVAGGATACKVAAVVCATAITAGGAAEVTRLAQPHAPRHQRGAAASAEASRPAPASTVPRVSVTTAGPYATHGATTRRHVAPPVPSPARTHAATPRAAAPPRPYADEAITAPPLPPLVGHDDEPVLLESRSQGSSGGTAAPADTAPVRDDPALTPETAAKSEPTAPDTTPERPVAAAADSGGTPATAAPTAPAPAAAAAPNG